MHLCLHPSRQFQRCINQSLGKSWDPLTTRTKLRTGATLNEKKSKRLTHSMNSLYNCSAYLSRVSSIASNESPMLFTPSPCVEDFFTSTHGERWSCDFEAQLWKQAALYGYTSNRFFLSALGLNQTRLRSNDEYQRLKCRPLSRWSWAVWQ